MQTLSDYFCVNYVFVLNSLFFRCHIKQEFNLELIMRLDDHTESEETDVFFMTFSVMQDPQWLEIRFRTE